MRGDILTKEGNKVKTEEEVQIFIEIEKQREKLHLLAEQNLLTDPSVLAASVQLDILLNKCYKIDRQKRRQKQEGQ